MLRYCVILLLIISNGINTHLISSEQLNAVPELIVDKFSKTEPFTIGIKFSMEPGWYLYWQNPGDGGIPPVFEWDLPVGYSVSDTQFPVPQKFYGVGALSYGHTDGVVFIVDVVPSSTRMLKYDTNYRAFLSWMVCEDACYLEEKSLSGSLDELQERPDEIARARSKLPKAIANMDIDIDEVTINEMAYNSLQVKLSISGSDAHLVQDFYPLSIENFVIHHSGITVADNVITFRVSPYSHDAELNEISGLLVTKDAGYKFSYTLPYK